MTDIPNIPGIAYVPDPDSVEMAEPTDENRANRTFPPVTFNAVAACTECFSRDIHVIANGQGSKCNGCGKIELNATIDLGDL